MKFIVAIISLFSVGMSWGQDVINWTPPIEISGSVDGHRPRIELLSDNTPVVIWAQFNASSDKNYFFSKWGGTDFLSPFQLNDAPLLTYDWGGTEIAVDGDVLYTVFKESNVTNGRVYVRRSLDGGLTWGGKIEVEDSSGELAMYPGVTAYDGNHVLITYMTHGPGGTNAQYIVKQSDDLGQTFSLGASVSADFGEEACYCCPPAIVGNSEYQVMSFRNDENNIRDMKAGISTNDGVSFDEQISLDDHNWVLSSCPATGGDVVLNGSTLYSTYMSKGEGDEMIYFIEDDLSDAMSYLEAPAVVDSLAMNMNHPHLTNIGDTVVLIWEQTSGGEIDLWYNFSFDGMNGWNEETAASVFQLEGAQTKPDVMIGTDGSIHVVYHDAELDRIMYTRGEFSMVSLNELSEVRFQVYPNPTSDVLVVSEEEGVAYRIVDVYGSVLLQGEGKEVDIQEIASGVYFVEVGDEISYRFVIER